MKLSEGKPFAGRLQTQVESTAVSFRMGAWIKTNGFILGLFAVVLLAFVFPDPPRATDGYTRI